MSLQTWSGWVFAATVIMPDDLAQLFVEESSDACILISSDGRVGFWNRGAEGVFRHTREEALNRDLVELIIPGNNREAIRKTLASAAVEPVISVSAPSKPRWAKAAPSPCCCPSTKAGRPHEKRPHFYPPNPTQPNPP
jgi:hypothetical protein